MKLPPTPPEAKGHKWTCKIDKIGFCLESKCRGIRAGHFSLLNDSVQLWASNDPEDDWVSLKNGGPESSGGLSMTPSRLWAQHCFNMKLGLFAFIIVCWCYDGETKAPLDESLSPPATDYEPQTFKAAVIRPLLKKSHLTQVSLQIKALADHITTRGFLWPPVLLWGISEWSVSGSFL